MPLRLSLRIFDHEPARPSGAQVWRGGATDLTTRTMIADPPRWLTIDEGSPVPAERPALREWMLEQINPGDLPSPENAGGVILVSMNVDPEREEEFNDWYNTCYIPGFLQVPGVIRARRFTAIEAQPKYLTVYEFENPDVPDTKEWMAARASNPWSRRVRAGMRLDEGSPAVFERIFPKL